jgi:uncharacterized protein
MNSNDQRNPQTQDTNERPDDGRYSSTPRTLNESAASGTSRRGFASMDEERQRAIASEGGRAAHARGTAHEFTSDEAREAGRKGGEAVSQNREHMAAIGRRGGEARGAAQRRLREAEEEQNSKRGSAERSGPSASGLGAPGRHED